MITIIRAIVYYVLFYFYTIMYNFIAELLYYAERIFAYRLDLKDDEMKKYGLYHDLCYYYSHGYLLLLKLVGVNITFSGDSIRKKERVLYISNHRSKFDGPLIHVLLTANGCSVKTISKYSVKYIPIIGSAGFHTGTIFIERRLKDAEKTLIDASRNCISDKCSIFIFPEGATMSPDVKFKSDAYSVANKLPITNNTIIPRTTGFSIIKENGQFDTIGNMTIQYSNPEISGHNLHSYFDLFTVFPKQINIDLKYEQFSANDLVEKFLEKDKLLDKKIKPEKVHPLGDSIPIMLFNSVLFITFYYFALTTNIFGFFVLGVSLVSVVRVLIS